MEIGESVAVPPLTKPVKVHAALLLESVTFGGNHVVEQDTLGNFAPPEWLRGRSKQWPVCYTRAKPVKVTAKFTVVIHPTAAEDVRIKARLALGSSALEWNGSVHCGPSDHEVVTAELTSTGPLPNEVGCFDAAEVEFSAAPPGDSFSSAGASRNVLYVTLGDPSGTPAYWTLLDISCRAAAGSTTAEGVVGKSFVPFTSRTLTRKRDGVGLTYWNPDTTTATNTQQLLSSSDGSGQCGSWSEFLIDMYKVHGITSSDKVLIVRTVPDWLGSVAGFLVKNWEFSGSGSHAPPFTHKMWTECIKKPGIPGQRNPDPPPAFFNHFIVRSFGKFYDPSYGAGPIADQTSWEVGAIDGLFSHGYTGYPKSANPATLLLQFRNAATTAAL